MVLTDDNYATIVDAIAEGRRLFANLRNVVHYLLSANASEVFYVLVGFVAFGFIGEPLVAVQLLWINLISDSLPAIALGMEMPTRDLMADPPGRGRDVLSTRNTLILLAQGAILAGCTLAVLLLGTFALGVDHSAVQTMVFTTLVFSQLLHALSIWARGGNSKGGAPSRLLVFSIAGSALLQLLVVYLPLGNAFLRTVPVEAGGMALVVGASLLSMVLVRLLNRAMTSEPGEPPRSASGL
jgi:Ca2+-transporting ATPase